MATTVSDVKDINLKEIIDTIKKETLKNSGFANMIKYLFSAKCKLLFESTILL